MITYQILYLLLTSLAADRTLMSSLGDAREVSKDLPNSIST